MMTLDCRGKSLDLTRPVVMGILNITPDSFSDGGHFVNLARAMAHARQMVEEGAAIIDVGGESTRPGAEAVPAHQELDRLIPVIEALRSELDVPISVDTCKPEVMREAVSAGAGLINDVYALRYDGAINTVADLGVPVCLMHMQGEPRTMQHQPHYQDVVREVKQFLEDRIAACVQGGIGRERIIVDPGFGFGKGLGHNLSLLKHLPALLDLGCPVLVGASRKSMIGSVIDAPVEQRLFGSIAVAALAAWQGARVLRVHDVKATSDALKMVAAVDQAI